MQHKTILGIDPGTKEMGLAVLRGSELLHFGVQRLRNGDRPYEVIGQATRRVLAAIEKHAPQVVVLETPFNLPTKRAHLLNVIDEELRKRSEEVGLEVVELSPMAVRAVVADNPRATKIDVAERLVHDGFPQLRHLIPKRPKRAALGLRPKDRYWLHAFDALALACAAREKDSQSPHPAGISRDGIVPRNPQGATK
jgi:RNase H-fold protein (predicted Holliday junction resolvase)